MEITKPNFGFTEFESSVRSGSLSDVVNVRLGDGCKAASLNRERSKKSSLRLGARKLGSDEYINFNFEETDKMSSSNQAQEDAETNKPFNVSPQPGKFMKNNEVSEIPKADFSPRPTVFHSADDSMKKIFQEGEIDYRLSPERTKLIKHRYCGRSKLDKCNDGARSRLDYSSSESIISDGEVKVEEEKELFLRELNLLRVGSWHEGMARKEKLTLFEQKEKPKSKRILPVGISYEAQRKFGSAKSISSQQFFDEASSNQYSGDASRLARFMNCSSISSDMYFNNESCTGSDYIDIEQVQESVKESIIKVAGKLGTLANEMFKNIQSDLPYIE